MNRRGEIRVSWKHVKCAVAFAILGAMGIGFLWALWNIPELLYALAVSISIAWALYTGVNCLSDYFDGKNK